MRAANIGRKDVPVPHEGLGGRPAARRRADGLAFPFPMRG